MQNYALGYCIMHLSLRNLVCFCFTTLLYDKRCQIEIVGRSTIMQQPYMDWHQFQSTNTPEHNRQTMTLPESSSTLSTKVAQNSIKDG